MCTGDIESPLTIVAALRRHPSGNHPGTVALRCGERATARLREAAPRFYSPDERILIGRGLFEASTVISTVAITPYFWPGSCFLLAQVLAGPGVKSALGKGVALLAGDLAPYRESSARENAAGEGGRRLAGFGEKI